MVPGAMAGFDIPSSAQTNTSFNAASISSILLAQQQQQQQASAMGLPAHIQQSDIGGLSNLKVDVESILADVRGAIGQSLAQVNRPQVSTCFYRLNSIYSSSSYSAM
jgi:hypothetical protein